MKRNKIFKHFLEVVTSNITTIISGIFVGFLLPKLLSVNDYGVYKTFTLYLTYVGFFSLGIIDGIVLKYGDKDYESIDKPRFRSYFSWYFIIHVFFATVLLLFAMVVSDKALKFVWSAIAINMVATNFTGYFQQISQITQRFAEYSIRKVLQSVVNIVTVSGLYLLAYKGTNVDYRAYIVSVVFVNTIMTIWYVRTYKDIVFGPRIALVETKGEIYNLIKTGFPLLFANLCSSLILTMDKQFVNLLFSREEYAVYAFAYNMLSLVTVATSAVATVLYPTLKRTDKSKLKNRYSILISVMLVIVYGALVLYFPLCAFVEWFLPKYYDSLVIFRIIFPGLAISSCITVIMHNYYKVLGENLRFFIKSIFVLGISCVANGIAYYLFRSTSSISIASILTMVFWYLFIENDIIKKYKINRWRNIKYLLTMMIGFYLVTCAANRIMGFILYLVYFALGTFILQQDLVNLVVTEHK